MMKTIIRIFILCCAVVFVCTGEMVAQNGVVEAHESDWVVESEDEGYVVEWKNDSLCRIVAPKGLTMWYKKKLDDGAVIEYDALVKGNRVSDLNCFWMATDPGAKDGSVFERMGERKGKFENCYSLKLYYVGYGGNYNTTTRFRRYDGDTNELNRPQVLKEYTDNANLLQRNHWYHVKISTCNGKVEYTIDGRKLVDWTDGNPLKSGWFGLRTTLSEVWMRNFKVRAFGGLSLDCGNRKIPLTVVKGDRDVTNGVSFGVPFAKGELFLSGKKAVKGEWLLNDGGVMRKTDTWKMAQWDDGSVKWLGVSSCVGGAQSQEADDDCIRAVVNGAKEVMVMNGREYEERNVKVTTERSGDVCTVVKKEGLIGPHQFKVRMYFYQGTDHVKIVHTFIYGGDQEKDVISALGMRFDIPMKEEVYNRYVAFGSETDAKWEEPVQPLTGRMPLSLGMDWNVEHLQKEHRMVPQHEQFDSRGQTLLKEWASWDGYKLSQITDNSYYIRKRATSDSPWIGTVTGTHSDGKVTVKDGVRSFSFRLKDMWQSYPSGLEVKDVRSDEAAVMVWLWSPDAEPMNLKHYDKVAHGLMSSYEDVQDTLSTPYGIARTHTMWVSSSEENEELVIVPTVEYLKEKNAFAMRMKGTAEGVNTNGADSLVQQIERYLDFLVEFYKDEVVKQKWYGFWNYGDFMHSYDTVRESWQYDVGGYAWDNTELGTPMWLWYMFLRTGRTDLFELAVAMTRHNSEVDCYHLGGLAGLGSRHNVSHWGCGAKESRISQAAFNRFLYYLTADERAGELMSDVKDADQMLYTLDPMRLAEPRDQYPCNAPARLRIGPDWLAYVGNWMTEWERTGNKNYKEKIIAGMRSIAKLPNGLFTGNKALGFDPKTGELSYDGDPKRMNTNHLMTIMGGFEVMNELMMMVDVPEFEKVWLEHAEGYDEKSVTISHNHFPVRRLSAYATFAGAKKTKLESEEGRGSEGFEGFEGSALRHAQGPGSEVKRLRGSEGKGAENKNNSSDDKVTEILKKLLNAVQRQNPRDTNSAALWSLDAMYVLGCIE